jgi:membrane associated rhomboid family serine protease
MDRITRAFRRRFSIPVGTLAFIIATVYSFFHFAGGAFFSPDFSVVHQFGLNYARPFTFFSYTFIHLWILHLLANITFIFVFGAIVERRFGVIEFVCLYVIGAALAGLFAQGAGLVFDHKMYVIVGASGAAFVLLGAALAIRPWHAIASYLVLSFFIVPAILSANIVDLRDNAQTQLAVKAETISVEQVKVIEAFEKKEIDQPTFTAINQTLAVEKLQTVTQIKGIAEARQVEAVTPIAETTHINAVFIGAMIAFMFRPELLHEWLARITKATHHLH